jgi:subtilase family serine protease
VSNDGKNTFKFLPEFPTSCPYITAVGATQNFEPEVVAYRPANSLGPDGKLHGFYSSGGGFSEYVLPCITWSVMDFADLGVRYFTRPSYQDAVVPAYIKRLNGEYAGLFNPSTSSHPPHPITLSKNKNINTLPFQTAAATQTFPPKVSTSTMSGTAPSASSPEHQPPPPSCPLS